MKTAELRVRNRGARRAGSVLLVALGFLVMLVMFASVLVVMTRVEKQAASNYIDRTKAKMIADAGLERTRQQLRNMVLRTITLTGVENELGTYDPATSKRIDWLYDERGVPLAITTKPSFSDTLERVGTEAGVDMLKNAYQIKVLDCASMVNVNHPNAGVTDEMLRNLFVELKIDGPDARGMASQIVENRKGRPGDRYSSKANIRGGLGKNYLKYWPLIADYVTTDGLVDATTIKSPRFTSKSATVSTDPARWKDDTEIFEPRFPINVNTAPREVLVAAFTGIKAPRDLVAAAFARINASDPQGGADLEITVADAQNLADAVIARRRGPRGDNSDPYPTGRQTWSFVSWMDFWDFLHGRNLSPSPDGWQAGLITSDEIRLRTGVPDNVALRPALKRAMLMANANPNSDLNKFFPDPFFTAGRPGPLSKEIDKADLAYYTTELCFNSRGRYEVTSLGRVLGEGGITISHHTASEIVKIYDIYTLTTQKDFEADRIPFQTIIRADTEDEDGDGNVSEPAELHHAVLTAPEYCNQVAIRGKAVETTGQPAGYDGHLQLNELVLAQTLTNDLLMGFTKGVVTPLIHPGYKVPTGANMTEAKARKSTLTNPTEASKPRGIKDASGNPLLLLRRGQDIDNLFTGDTNLHTGGLLLNFKAGTPSAERRFIHLPGAFYGGPTGRDYYTKKPAAYQSPDQQTDNFFGDYGTVEFWVKPLAVSRTSGFGGSTRYTWFCWGGRDGSTTPATENMIEIYQENNRLYLAARMYGPSGTAGTVQNLPPIHPNPTATPPETADRGVLYRDLWPPLLSDLQDPPNFADVTANGVSAGRSMWVGDFMKENTWYHIALAYGTHDSVTLAGSTWVAGTPLTDLRLWISDGTIVRELTQLDPAGPIRIPDTLSLREEYDVVTVVDAPPTWHWYYGWIVTQRIQTTSHKTQDRFNANSLTSFIDNPAGRPQFQDGPVVLGAGLDSSGNPRDHARAIFDNFRVHHYIRPEYITKNTSPDPPSRYFDRSTDPDGNTSDLYGGKAVYQTRMKAIPRQAGATLGAVLYTAYYDPALPNAVKVGLQKGNLSTNMSPGEALPTDQAPRLHVEMGVNIADSSQWPLNSTPVLADVSVIVVPPDMATIYSTEALQ